MQSQQFETTSFIHLIWLLYIFYGFLFYEAKNVFSPKYCTTYICLDSVSFCTLVKVYRFPLQVQWRRDPVQLNGHCVRQKDDIREKNCRAPDPAHRGEWEQKSRVQHGRDGETCIFSTLSLWGSKCEMRQLSAFRSEIITTLRSSKNKTASALFWTPSIHPFIMFVTLYLSTRHDVSEAAALVLMKPKWNDAICSRVATFRK